VADGRLKVKVERGKPDSPSSQALPEGKRLKVKEESQKRKGQRGKVKEESRSRDLLWLLPLLSYLCPSFCRAALTFAPSPFA
jgi:hypothetical protein